MRVTLNNSVVLYDAKYQESPSVVDEIRRNVMDITDGVAATGKFFQNLDNEGLWFALFHKHFGEWLHDFSIFLLQSADYVIPIATILALLGLAGSQRAKKYTYWSLIIFCLMKLMQGVLI